MRLCTFEAGGRRAPGRVEGDRVVELDAPSLAAWLESGGGDVAEHALADVRLVAPIPHPPSVRDFYAFERHVRSARAERGLEMAPEWYRIPVFYFSNPAAVHGPDEEVLFPPESSAWDYELEAAAVVGAEGRIAGFTVMNDWSARDLQKMEMAVGLGPAKGKDFATSLGPVLVTTDELGDLRLEMAARVNGEQRSLGSLGDLHWPWEELARHAARNTRLMPGDVLGSGTVGTGCILEHGDGRWLRPGDVVELEIERIGVLRNTVAAGPQA
ncbi:MAG TPA: fumarylacetoacetate hydrolase family protein [Gaiellaceae bacterium]|nr:fumarylacetoacetate hydrolase family protein [Gaiellaceae bacterium]